MVAAAAPLPRAAGHARMMREAFAGVAARAMAADLARLVGAWRPDVVVRESQEYASVVAAEHHGVPHARVALGLTSIEHETLGLVAPAVDALRAGLGLPPDPDGGLLRAEPCLTLVPPALDHEGPPAAPAPHRFRAPPPTPGPPSGARDDRGEPLVYLTFGSVAALLGFFPGLYRAAVDALAGLPARVLVATGADADPADLGSLPPNVRAERWVAHDAALASASAVACHGGHGTVLDALARGLPLAVMPLFGDDQWRNAERVDALDAGVAVHDDRPLAFLDHPDAAVVAGLRGAVEAVLGDPRHRDAAARVGAEMAALPPPDAAAGVLRDLVAAGPLSGP